MKTENNTLMNECVMNDIDEKQFSSMNFLKMEDIISGDRILSLCDFVLCTVEIFNYHKNMEKFIDMNKIIMVENFNDVDSIKLNKQFNESNKNTIKLFVYTHILDSFCKFILPQLDIKLNFVLYLHNSDDTLEMSHIDMLSNAKHIEKVYSQNVTMYSPEKIKLLPIGIANSMWNHGDIASLYETIDKTHHLKKTRGIYININPTTHPYRHTVLNELKNRDGDFNIVTVSKPYDEYLEELSTHKFCLCVRGNGISCHREWESLYLGVIPVIVNNKHTNLDAYTRYLKDLNLPFFEIKEENFDRYDDAFFNEELHEKIMSSCNDSYSEALKLNFYK